VLKIGALECRLKLNIDSIFSLCQIGVKKKNAYEETRWKVDAQTCPIHKTWQDLPGAMPEARVPHAMDETAVQIAYKPVPTKGEQRIAGQAAYIPMAFLICS
jgi:hypothetical protein